MALKNNRRFYGCELKQEYYDAAIVNFGRAIRDREIADKGSLFVSAK
jgi:hypothetical protein